jgi:hypothetical protein
MEELAGSRPLGPETLYVHVAETNGARAVALANPSLRYGDP